MKELPKFTPSPIKRITSDQLQDLYDKIDSIADEFRALLRQADYRKESEVSDLFPLLADLKAEVRRLIRRR
jgi:dsDNA-binding SOS-regulon protein|tara:strand:- start:449 stop:661 length:213 start_codon:yes stop_codon:yes gene_type:complete